MGWFDKSEAELNTIAAQLEKRRIELDNRASDIQAKEANLAHERELFNMQKEEFEAERSRHASELRRNAEAIAAEKKDLEKRRSELTLLEAKAKAGFADAQRQAFKEVIEKRQADLDARQRDLDALANDIAERLASLHEKESELARRELDVTQREQKADAGFADKVKALADETARQRQANQAEAKRLEQLVSQLAAEREAFEEEVAALRQREREVKLAEQKRDNGFAEERTVLDDELRDKRAKMETAIAIAREEKLAALEEEIAKLKTARLAAISNAEAFERNRIRGEIAKEREEWTKQQESARKQLEAERAELEKRKGMLSAQQAEFEGRMTELEANERILERKAQRLEQRWEEKHNDLQDLIASQLAEERRSLDSERETLRAENDRLRDSLRVQVELLGAFDQLKRQLGGKDPVDIVRQLNSKTDELTRLREELATRPTEEMREKYQRLETKTRRLEARCEELSKQIEANATAVAAAKELRRRNSELEADNKMLAQKAERFELAANEAQAELHRLRAAYERPAEVSARYKEIELPRIPADAISRPIFDDNIDELTWLDNIRSACDNYGLRFHPRILKAFHTALKTAEWSPLTILAGVSGTGKSELPRLYSHFGGIVFEPLSVQPNWDSQESMLGFFNSIDNKFDAQPVLRFLAQSQKQWIERRGDKEGYPGLQDAVCLILLDEMNLAHPELYFADFLSKLELRRGMKGTDVPYLSVKIGAGLPPYQLPLGRNVLWTGTMNQDETTKSLSDKVLDRSIIVFFPRPTKLKRRLELTPLDEKNRGALLHKRVWQSWLAKGTSFSPEDVKPFMSFMEELNKALGVVGRALGHRVWQSIEYYMANYPDVRAAQKTKDKDELAGALHTAYEDQLVQKVMPKLRGIDTRGTSRTDCLDKILALINTGIGGNPFNLAEDFRLACELGYGQFIWQSANYLKDEQGRDTVGDATEEAVADSQRSHKVNR
ncbi:MAG: hypothetical protein Kow0040_24470 [Thermogutta sp.]